MFKKSVLFLFLWSFVSPAFAQMPYLEEMQALGTVSGQGLACGASKYDHFEMLARAIMLTKASNNNMLQKGVYAYTEAKASVYRNKQMDGGYLCGEIASRFDEQEIFQMSLYEDGTIKMPDGNIITPKMPYDAKQIYRKDDKLKDNLKSIYDGASNKAQAQVLKQGGKLSSSVAKDAPSALTAAPVARNKSAQSLPTPRAKPAEDNSIGHIRRR